MWLVSRIKIAPGKYRDVLTKFFASSIPQFDTKHPPNAVILTRQDFEELDHLTDTQLGEHLRFALYRRLLGRKKGTSFDLDRAGTKREAVTANVDEVRSDMKKKGKKKDVGS